MAQGILGLRRSEDRRDGDFAILYRTHAQSRAIEEAMRARRIRYRIVGGVSFFQRREVKDITEYLRLLANPHADSAFERVVNVRKEKLKVLLVDGEPRYEFRYLKNYLEREETIDLSVVLISSDVEYSEQDLRALPYFPAAKEELHAFARV